MILRPAIVGTEAPLHLGRHLSAPKAQYHSRGLASAVSCSNTTVS